MKYRIYQNGNGYYLIKRKRLFFWVHFSNGWDNSSLAKLFNSKEEIIEFLNSNEEWRVFAINNKKLTLITEINTNNTPPLCHNCKKEIGDIK